MPCQGRRQASFVSFRGRDSRKEAGLGNDEITGSHALATAALLLVAVTVCADDGNDPAATRVPPPARRPRPQVHDAAFRERDCLRGGVGAVCGEYFATVDQLRQDPKRPASRSRQPWRSSTELPRRRTCLKSERSKGLHQIGDTKVVELKVQSVNLDNSDPTPARCHRPIDVCWDVSDVDIIDDERQVGRQPRAPGHRLDPLHGRELRRGTTSPTDGWRVAGGQDLEKTPCAAS